MICIGVYNLSLKDCLLGCLEVMKETIGIFSSTNSTRQEMGFSDRFLQ